MPGWNVNSFQVFRSSTASCSTSQCCVLHAAELPLPKLVWVMRTVFMKSQTNWSFCREDSFQRERDRNEPWEGGRKAELRCGICYRIQRTNNSWLPCHLQQLKNYQITKIPSRWFKIKWKNNQTDYNCVSPPLPHSLHITMQFLVNARRARCLPFPSCHYREVSGCLSVVSWSFAAVHYGLWRELAT